ncbi:MAG: class I SAM-dependent methyltransferase [Bryobacteraceae bacterium]
MESAELIEILREVRERVRVRNPQTAAGVDIALPDLTPLMHARDSAMGKVAAIGTVNPRAGGPLNAVVQAWKRLVARMLDWHVREQVEFNRNVVAYADAVLEALRETNRALSEMGGRLAEQERIGHEVDGETRDMRDHWAAWRVEWEHKLQQNEVAFLRSVADLQGAFQHRVTLMEASHRDLMAGHNTNFHAAMERHGMEIQKRLWADLEKMRMEVDRTTHMELRLIRRRLRIAEAVAAPLAGPSAQDGGETSQRHVPLDYGKFAERFRGSEECVKTGQQIYLPYFEGCRNVLDIGCGRGEFLEMMRDAAIPARGIDLGAESVAACRLKGLDAEIADAFPYLASLEEGALDGIFCSQVVEHLPPERLPELIRLCAERLARGGVIAIETPNPECLAIFGTHFYLDPTHTRPVPHPLLIFYLEECGVGLMELRRLSPAVDTMPSLASLPDDFRGAFFGSLDYAVIGRKL